MSTAIPHLPREGDSTPDTPITEKKDRFASSPARDDDSLEDASSAGDTLIEEKSKGVVEMEYLAARINTKYLVLLYGGFMVLAYTLALNQSTSGRFLETAVSASFGVHALQSTINTVTAVFQAMSQPPIAKFADVFGRVNAYIGCVVFYVIGYIIVASSNNIVTFAVGNSIYILGITGLFLLQNIIISDISSLRNRYWWTIFPSIPGAINTWVAGDVVDAFLQNNRTMWRWRWGFAIFIILTPILATPIILVLWRGTRAPRTHRNEIRAARRGERFSLGRFKQGARAMFWQLDFIGLVLFVLGFGMFFVTITLANSRTARWSDPHAIALLILGGLFIIGFGLYEHYYAPHPLIPFRLLRNKTVIGCMLIALIHPMAGRIVNGYLNTFFVVAAGVDVKTATRLSTVPSFAATFIAIFASMVVRYTRRIKPIIVLGFAVQTLAFGLMIRFRQSHNSVGEFIAVQTIKGFGIGCISFPTQAVIQSAAPHEHLGAITAAYLIVFYLSSGIGAAIGGAIWTNIVPSRISEYMQNEALAAKAYGNPFGFAVEYGLDTLPRQALQRAQDEAQRIIVIVGTCVCVLGLLVSIFMINNVHLPDTQSLEESENAVKVAEAERKGGKRAEAGALNVARAQNTAM
ncbi:major facilitator superfamily domain-containing protein [Dioszegia hungarica]|uniref:Major facilitator superfamily domain-containing protein n=1 Tax=Dioszegia hungarica TaxID=4972 RepID=A0AA38LUL9_9TREE|nr:major facilitator superfamily domain-containing protein [Dioszegia hungarica]KAI9635925.1 major facilitator superfamily domain-containing protein [Dioszegia hungarica]